MNRIPASSTNNTITYLGSCICLIITCAVIFLIRYSITKSKENDASTSQMLIGKKIGSFCSSDQMCASNNCRSSICVI
jgi:hypothetical protein